MTPATTNTLLDYSLDTVPDPLQASPAQGNVAYGALSFVVSNGGGTVVNLSQLQFALPVGTLAQELTSDPGAILWATGPGTLWNVSMTSPGVFLLLPQSGAPIPVSTDGLVIQFFNIPVNQQVGTVAITVTETATNDATPAQERNAVFDVAKFPYGFYFANLSAQVPMVQDGATVTLTWQGSDNATYAMQWSEAPPVDVTNLRSWTSPALSSDTTFLLKATVVSQGETVVSYLSTTVIVANPELQASSLQVTGASNLQGATTLGTGSTQTTVNGNLTVNGTTLLSGNTTLSGSTVAGNLAVNGSLSSGSSAAFNDVAINGTLAAIKGAQTIGQGTYLAKTDGIVLASINTLGVPPSAKSQSWILAKMPYGDYYLSSGNYNAPGGVICNGDAAMSLPLAKGQSCSISFVYANGNQTNPNNAAVFLPLGGIPSDAELLVKVSDEVPSFKVPLADDNVEEQSEAIAGALLEAIRSGEMEQLKGVVKEILTRR